MPCWTRSEVELELNNPDLELLLSAAKSIGFWVYQEGREGVAMHRQKGQQYGYEFAVDGQIQNTSYSLVVKDGKVMLTGPAPATTAHINMLNRAYSTQIVKQTAKRYGWQLTQQNENKFVAARRF